MYLDNMWIIQTVIVSDLEYDGILLQLGHGPLGPEDGVDHVKES